MLYDIMQYPPLLHACPPGPGCFRWSPSCQSCPHSEATVNTYTDSSLLVWNISSNIKLTSCIWCILQSEAIYPCRFMPMSLITFIQQYFIWSECILQCYCLLPLWRAARGSTVNSCVLNSYMVYL